MAKKKRIATEAQESVAQRTAHRYRVAENELQEFMKDASVMELLKEFYQLIEKRNTTLDEALRAIKSEVQRSDQKRLVIEGLGAQKKYRTYYDTDFLSEHLPVKQAEMILTEKTVFELNEPLLQQLVRQGEIDNTVVREAYREEEQNPANVPGTPKPWSMPPLPIEE